MMIAPERNSRIAAVRQIDGSLLTVICWDQLGVSGLYTVIVAQPDGTVTGKSFKDETAWSDAERYANDELHRLGGDYTQQISL